MGRELFGTDGIRGPAGQYPLDEAGVCQIGKAIATKFAKPGQRILVGCDPRQSSPQLEAALTSGITDMGVDVDLVGVIPTPGLAYLTISAGVQAGVMITASHNAYTDNGIKVFTPEGDKLDDRTEVELNKLIDSDLSGSGQGDSVDAAELAGDYEAFLISTIEGNQFGDWKLAVDCANGATSFIAPRLFERLKASIVPLFSQPDGVNINQGCGATDTSVLQQTVKEQDLDAGVAFDGDGDRVVIIDEQGRALTGDHILYILAVCRKIPGVVATIMSNMGLETALQQQNISLHRTAVGDRYVLEGLKQTGFNLGGEQSGHIILPDYTNTGDGLMVALQVLKEVKRSPKSLGEWYDDLELLPQSLVNIPIIDKSLLDTPEIRSFITKKSEELKGTGRLLIRPSGTESLARVMVEAPDASEVANQITAELQALLNDKGAA